MEEIKTEKKQRGGARAGAGRKRTVTKRYMVNAPEDVAAILETADNKSEFICMAVRAYAAMVQRD